MRIPVPAGTSPFNYEDTALLGMKRAQMGDSLVAYSHNERSFVTAAPGTTAKKYALVLNLEPDVKDVVAGAKLLAHENNAFIGGIDGRRVTLLPLLPAVVEVRRRIAEVLSAKKAIQPWDIDVHVEWSAVEPRIESVTIRTREMDIDAEKADGVWKRVILSLPGGSNGWSVSTDLLTGVVQLGYGKPRSLPGRVALEEILPDTVQPDLWYRSAFGISTSGEVAAHNLKSAPHTILAGPTNSGKTNTIAMMIASRLMHGHDLIVIDPIKGVDFDQFRPFARFIAEDYTDSVAAMEWLIAEAKRRKAVLKANKVVNWLSLPDDVRARENIRPLTVVLDELGQLFFKVKPNTLLPKDHPTRLEQESVGVSKALLDAGTGEIARAYRFVGLFLVLASQKLLANMLGENGSELRSNCGNGVYLHPPGTDVDKGDLTLLFDATVDRAMENIVALDDGHSYGLAVTVAEGTGMSAARVAFAEPKSMESILRARGLQDAVPLNLGSCGGSSSTVSSDSWDDHGAPAPVPSDSWDDPLLDVPALDWAAPEPAVPGQRYEGLFD